MPSDFSAVDLSEIRDSKNELSNRLPPLRFVVHTYQGEQEPVVFARKLPAFLHESSTTISRRPLQQ